MGCCRDSDRGAWSARMVAARCQLPRRILIRVMHPFRAVVFDFDGTMLDSERPLYDAYVAAFREFRVELTMDVWKMAAGRGTGVNLAIDYLESELGREIDREAIRQRARSLRHDATREMPVNPGVAEHIAEAKAAGMKLAIASSSASEWVNGHLTRLGLLPSFDAVCTRDDVSQTKPAPDLYNLALERLNVKPTEAFAIEDSPNGVSAAQAAGMRCVAVPDSLTIQMDLSHADLIVSSLADLSLAQLAAAVAV